MTAAFFVTLATLLFEDDYLLVLLIFKNSDLDRCTFDERGAKASIGTLADLSGWMQ